MTLRRLRPQWARDEEEGWEVRSVDRYSVRYAEVERSIDVPVEDGTAPDGTATISVYPDGLVWRDQRGRRNRLTDDDRAVVLDRLTRALELLGSLPVLREGER